MMKKFITIFALFIWMINEAQDLNGDLPLISRPEPSVANLMMFEEIPVSNFTGIPHVNVPLFSLPTRSKDMGLNLALSYHPASGVMHNAQAGDCGVGWSLFSGGVITRALVHEPFSLDQAFNQFGNPNPNDIYQFNFLGYTSRLKFERNTDGTTIVRVLDNANNKLDFHFELNNITNEVNTIVVYDEKGYKFVFQDKDIKTYYSRNYTAAWHLTSVFDNNNNELIKFNYNSMTKLVGFSEILNANIYDLYKKESEIISQGYGKIKINYSTGSSSHYDISMKINSFELFDYNNNLRKKIKNFYESGKLIKVEALSPDESIKDSYNFNYKSNQINEYGGIDYDEWGYRKISPDCIYAHPVQNITTSNLLYTRYVTNGVLEEMVLPTGGKVKFDFESNTYTKYKGLTGVGWVLEDDPAQYNGTAEQNYFKQLENIHVETLNYHEFVGDGNNTITFTINENQWVYINFTPQVFTAEEAFPEGIVSPDPNAIHYPILYLNGPNYSGNNGLGYALSTFHPNGLPGGLSMMYKQNACLGERLFLNAGTYTVTVDAMSNIVKRGTFHLTKLTPLANPNKNIHGGGIRIKKIDYFDNQNSTQPTKTKNYNYNYFNDNTRTSGFVTFPSAFLDNEINSQISREPVGYKNVTVFETGLGKQEFTYSVNTDFSGIISFNDYRRGLLKKSKIINENGDVLSEVDYDYSHVDAAVLYQNYNYPGLDQRVGWSKLTKKTAKNYFSNHNLPVETIDEYEYNDNIRKVVKHKSTNTLGELVETNTIYHTGDSPFSQNRIAEISEMNITKNGVLIGKSKVNYATNWGTNQSHLPAFFESSKGTQAFYTRNHILAYDQFSNPTEVRQENGTTTTYIWGYNKTQVIAQIVNATNTQVATALGVSNVHQLTETNLTAINNLRTNATFTNCFITTAEYTPLVGINKVTDPKGDFMTYHYDNFNRLIHVKDRLGNILTESQYHTAVNSSDLNFVLNTTYKQATTSSLANPTITQANQHKVFIDGLGRPIQEIAHRQSNSGNDIISYIEYDEFGRRTKNYMPFADGTASLNHRPQAQAKAAQQGFYNTPAYQNTTNAYTESRHEASPLQRVLEQAAPGEDWHINAANKHTVRYEYLTNLDTDNVRKLRAIADEGTLITSGFYGISLNQSGFYGSGELYKTITKNENWKPSDIDRNTTHEYRNREGQVLLIRTFGDSEVNSGEDDSYQIHDTYYVYDQYGNLTYMIPPKADGTTITTTVLNNLCYQYRYDHKNRLVEKKLPQKHWEFLVYDKLDRVVAMGPALSPFMDAPANTNGWLIAKYDAMNRKIISAWMPPTATTTINTAGRVGFQGQYNSHATVNESKRTTDLNINNVNFRYSSDAWPTTGYHILTVNYFDDYNFPDAPTSFPTVLTQATFYNNTTKPKGLATGSWIRVLENQNQVRAERSFVLYDNKARAIRTRKTNYMGGYTQVDAQLDFAGKTLVSVIKHKRLNLSSVQETTIREEFDYTNQDRLRKHTHQITQGTTVYPKELLALYSYNELGQIINKRVGGTDSSNPIGLQKVDYTYNIRGWLTDINNVNNLNNGSDPQDVFAYKMNYNQTQNDTGYEVDAQYNGNISETYWRTSSDNTIRKYGFKYDHLNRLKDAKFQQPNDINPVPGKYDERLRYDKNGNITYLYRTGQNGTPIDDLTYQYFGSSNRLMVVQENPITNTPGFESKEVLPQDYYYDTYGNLTRDLNKGIGTSTTDGYRYNHLNQPIRLVKGTSNMQLFYNAAGQKVKKVVLQNGVTTTTDYLDGFQYKNTALEFFGHAEGFVANSNNTLRYVFQYKDQVGNVRVSYAANQSGQATILEENHYYPYGLKHAGYGVSASVANDGHKYRYNSREFHDELGLEMTAMDFRLYDNILGRFFGMDALSENYHYISPYHFSNCNPVMFADPTGLMPEWWPDWMKSMWSGSDDNTTWTNIGGGFRNNENGTIVSINAGSSTGGSTSEPFMTFTSYTHMVNFFNAFVPNVGGNIETLKFTNKGGGNYSVSWNSDTIVSLDEIIIRTTTKKVKVLLSLELYFDGKNLSLLNEGIEIISLPAVSGRPLEDGSFDYSIERQMMKRIGPIPAGSYYINSNNTQWWTDQSFIQRTAAIFKSGSWPGGLLSWGVARSWIEPFGADTYGRDNFSIHGGATPGSAGCIDLTKNDLKFFRTLEKYNYQNIIPLNVVY